MGPEVLGSILHQCSKTRAFRSGFSLHAIAVKMGLLESNVIISNHVLNMYAKCGKIDFARQVFDDMSERNLVSWSAMISGYDQSGKPINALKLFTQMTELPNEFVFASAISSCASLLAIKVGKQIHTKTLTLGYSSISFVSNSLVSMYMKCSHLNDAISVFTKSSEPNTVTYNAIITGLVDNKQVQKAYEMFKLMCQQGLVPNRFTLVPLLGNCTTTDDLWIGMELHCQAIKLNLDSIPFVGNMLITMYSKLNSIKESETIFWSINEKDIISWNTFISASSHALDHTKGITVFKEMIKTYNLIPDDFTYASALSACSGLASSLLGRQIHGNLIRTRFNHDTCVSNALINMYAKCGSIKHAITIFTKMPFRNLVSWNTLMTGFANHGLGKESIDLFNKMKDLNVNPDSLTFVSLLSSLNHAGLVTEGKFHFNDMLKTHGITPNVDHVSCIVDLLGRARRVKEAEEYMERFCFEEDAVVLGCLLSACNLHGDVVIGERTAKRLLKIKKISSSPFVLLSNLYASESMWDDVADVRKRLKDSLVRKEPGHSLIEIEGRVEKFTVGRICHSRIEEIVGVLKVLSFLDDEFSW
ncbi:hypothetical protein LXL04_028421 [Taraxacum kok-saghyz]